MIVEDSQNWLPEGAEVITEAEEITTDTWLPEGAVLENTEVEEDVEGGDTEVVDATSSDLDTSNFTILDEVVVDEGEEKDPPKEKGYDAATSTSQETKDELRKAKDEETLNNAKDALKDVERRGLKKQDWDVKLSELKETVPSNLYNHINDIVTSKFADNENGKISKKDILNTLESQIHDEDIGKDINKKYGYDTYIPFTEANPTLQNEIGILTSNLPVPIDSESIIGYSIDQDIRSTESMAQTDVDPITLDYLLTGETDVYTITTAHQPTIYYKVDVEGIPVKAGEDGTLTSKTLVSYPEDIEFSELQSQTIIGDVKKEIEGGSSDYIAMKLKQLKQSQEGLDEESLEFKGIETVITRWKQKQTRNLEIFSETSLKREATLFNDEDGVFNAPNESYLIDGVYSSFDPINAVDAALKNIQEFPSKIFNPTKKQADGSVEQQAEENFNNSTWRALGFYMQGGKVYSGIQFGEHGPKGGQEQFTQTKEIVGEGKDSKLILSNKKGVDFVELQFGEDGDNEKNAKKLTKFLKEHYKDTLILDEDNNLGWGIKNDQTILNNLEDHKRDMTRAYGALHADYQQLYEEISDEYGSSKIVDDIKEKIKNVDVIKTQFKFEIGEIGLIAEKYNVTQEENDRISAMPFGGARNRAIKKFNKNLQKVKEIEKKQSGDYNQLIIDQQTGLGTLPFKDTFRRSKLGRKEDQKVKTATYTFPSGIQIEIDQGDLRGYGTKDTTIGGSDAENQLRFNENLKRLELTPEEEALAQENGFNVEQIIELQQMHLNDQIGVAIEKIDQLEDLDKLFVDQTLALDKVTALSIAKQDRVAKLTLASLQGMTTSLDIQTEQRGLTAGEFGGWSLTRLSENATGMLAGGLEMFLMATQAINYGFGGSKESQKKYDAALRRVVNEKQILERYIRGDVNTKVNDQFNESYTGQVLGATIDMLFDIALMTGTGGGSFITAAGKKIGIKALARKELKKGLSFNKILKKTLSMNGPMFFKSYADIVEDMQSNPSFNEIMYKKDENGDFLYTDPVYKMDGDGFMLCLIWTF